MPSRSVLYLLFAQRRTDATISDIDIPSRSERDGGANAIAVAGYQQQPLP